MVVAGLLSGSAPAAQGTPSHQPLPHVALGGSCTAPSGVLPAELTAPPQWLRSTRTYPHVITAAIGARFTGVTCGGATPPTTATGRTTASPRSSTP